VSNFAEITCRLFIESDFREYQKWFSDSELYRRLGPLDNEWLEYILSDKSGAQYCFTEAQEIIGVAGVRFPSDECSHYILTDLAIRPDIRSTGYGSKLLSFLLSQPEFKTVKTWRTYVDVNNGVATKFFLSLGWVCLQECDDGSQMIEFENTINWPQTLYPFPARQ